MSASYPIPLEPPDTGGDQTRGQSLGRLLKSTREGHNIHAADAARALRIRVAYIQAIEAGAYNRLPGSAYALGFVRAYADYLGLDGEEAARRFKRETKGFEPQPPDLTFPEPQSRHSIPGGRILVMALVLAVCGYGLWYYLTRSGHPRQEQVAAVPAELLPVKPAPPRSEATTATAATQPGGAVSAALTAANDNSARTNPPSPPTLGSSAAQTVAVVASGDNGASTANAAPADPTAAQVSDNGPVYGATDPQVHILVKATADSWIQVKDEHQEIRFGKLLRAGNIYRVPNETGLVMRSGNPDGLTITVDGNEAPTLASGGKPRNIALDPARLMAGNAFIGNAPSPPRTGTASLPPPSSSSPPPQEE